MRRVQNAFHRFRLHAYFRGGVQPPPGEPPEPPGDGSYVTWQDGDDVGGYVTSDGDRITYEAGD